jgi:sugar phosphate isomerase/epimerase
MTVRASPLPYKEKLKKLREIGYQSIQGSVPDGMTLPEFKAFMDDLGMEISCFSGGRPPLQFKQELMDACHAFDCDEVMVGSMPVEYRADYDSYMRGIERLNQAAAVLAKENIFLSYHNHAQEFRKFNNGKRGIDLLMENLDPKSVHFLFDTHWLQAGGADILEWMDRFKDRMHYLHIKDYRLAPANYESEIGSVNKQFSQIGDGQLPWEQIIKKGLENGIQAFIVEQDNCYDEDCFDCAAFSYRTLKSLGLN